MLCLLLGGVFPLQLCAVLCKPIFSKSILMIFCHNFSRIFSGLMLSISTDKLVLIHRKKERPFSFRGVTPWGDHPPNSTSLFGPQCCPNIIWAAPGSTGPEVEANTAKLDGDGPTLQTPEVEFVKPLTQTEMAGIGLGETWEKTQREATMLIERSPALDSVYEELGFAKKQLFW